MTIQTLILLIVLQFGEVSGFGSDFTHK